MLQSVTLFFTELWQNFRIADAIDILVIASLLYWLLVWFRQAASRGLLIGVSVLTVVYFVARGLDMYLTSLVFHMGFAVLLVVLVVLFQEEIRRVFERVASWGTLRSLRRGTTPAPEVDTIVEAAFAMATRKTGALIALQGREPLRRHIVGGIPLSGRVSEPLLFSIFDTGSAGHDGAVLIERNRVDKFGVHLPISKNQEETRGRGTRHCAAVGLSECSDAFVIVVSEERGQVSVAQGGKLAHVRTAADLKNRIEAFLQEKFPSKDESTWRRMFTRHAHLKLLALLLAIAGWFVLAFDVEKIQTSVVVPIEYRNVPPHKEVDASAPVEALVTLSGSEREFRLLDRRVLRISIDLSKMDHDTDSIPIRDEDVRLPPNMKVDRIQPSEIPVRLKSPVEPASPNSGSNQ